MAKDEGALRQRQEQAHANLEDLRARWREKPTKATGDKLEAARKEASAANQALWDAVPDEKPPSQTLM